MRQDKNPDFFVGFSTSHHGQVFQVAFLKHSRDWGRTSGRLEKYLALLISRLRARHLADVRPLLTPP